MSRSVLPSRSSLSSAAGAILLAQGAEFAMHDGARVRHPESTSQAFAAQNLQGYLKLCSLGVLGLRFYALVYVILDNAEEELVVVSSRFAPANALAQAAPPRRTSNYSAASAPNTSTVVAFGAILSISHLPASRDFTVVASAKRFRFRAADASEAASWVQTLNLARQPPPPPTPYTEVPAVRLVRPIMVEHEPLDQDLVRETAAQTTEAAAEGTDSTGVSSRQSNGAASHSGRPVSLASPRPTYHKKSKDWQLVVDGDYVMPATVLRYECEFQGQKIVILLVGVSPRDIVSRVEVRTLITAVKPHSVIVELDPRRLEDLERKRSMQSNHRSKQSPGLELLEAVEMGRQVGSQIVFSNEELQSAAPSESTLRMPSDSEVKQSMMDFVNTVPLFAERPAMSYDAVIKELAKLETYSSLVDSVRQGEMPVTMLAQLLDLLASQGSSRAARRYHLALMGSRNSEFVNSVLFGAGGKVRVAICDLDRLWGVVALLDRACVAKGKDAMTLAGARRLLARGLELNSVRDCLEALTWLSRASSQSANSLVVQSYVLRECLVECLSCLKKHLGDGTNDSTMLIRRVFEVLSDLTASAANVKYLSFTKVVVDELVSAALLGCLAVPEVCVEGCFVIQQLATAGWDVDIVSRSTHLCVLAAMRKHEHHFNVNQAGAYTLAVLSRNVQLRQQLLQDGAVPVLVGALSRFGGLGPKETGTLVLNAICALGQVTNIKLTTGHMAVDSSEANRVVLKEVLGLVRRGKENPAVAETKTELELAVASTATLFTLANFQKNNWNLCDIGAHKAVLDLASVFSESWQVAVNVALLVVSFSRVRGVKNAMVEHGVQDLLTVAKERFSGQAMVVRRVSEALAAVTQRDEVEEVFVVKVNEARLGSEKRLSKRTLSKEKMDPTQTQMSLGPAAFAY